MTCVTSSKKLCPDFKRGDTWTIVVVFWETEEMLSKTPFHEGTTASAHIRNKATNELVLEADSCVVDSISSSVTVTFNAANTVDIIVNATYVMDVEITYPDGTVHSTEDLYIPVYKDRTFS